MKRLMFLCACCLFSTTALAADSRGVYITHGEGNTSCGSWTVERQEGTFYPEAGWVMGFLSAYNLYVFNHKDVADGTDANGIRAWIDNYCAAHPLSSIDEASLALIAELRSSRPQR